jgi:hypothetical protein
MIDMALIRYGPCPLRRRVQCDLPFAFFVELSAFDTTHFNSVIVTLERNNCNRLPFETNDDDWQQ